jgi:hypothetical protein
MELYLKMSKDRATPNDLKYQDISNGYSIIQQAAGAAAAALFCLPARFAVAPAKPLRVIA